MNRPKLDDTLAVLIQSVIAAEPHEGRIGQLDLSVLDSHGKERKILVVVTERVPEGPTDS